MNLAEPLMTYHAGPAAAIAAVREHDGPILLDLDETLYLRNSTEDFIDSARPALLALALLRVLDLFAPWRWTGGEATRDCWRVLLVSLLFPWSLIAWRRRGAVLARRFGNADLLAAVQHSGTVPIVATTGFQPIVRPLVSALGLPFAAVVSSRLFHFGDRRHGKLERVLAVLGDDTVRRAMVVTDSEQDLPLLAACAKPLRTTWPGARYRPALSHVYLPGQYLSQVKHPGERYILRAILQEDFALWLLSSMALAAAPFQQVVGLGLLLISFWAIYERGYFENDQVAARHEQQPKLSAAFHLAVTPTPPLQPWIWAAACGAAGIWALHWPRLPALPELARWAALLLATYGWFRLYNSYDKSTRVWLYFGLQLSRTAAFLVLVPVTAVGAAALAAHLFARWMPYYIYRCGSNAWPKAPLPLLRLALFGLFTLLLTASPQVQPALDWSTATLFGWSLYRAWPDLRGAWCRALRLHRSLPPRSGA